MNREYHVYAICKGSSPDQYLTREMSGTRRKCEAYIRQKVRAGRPTHFNVVSSRDWEAAEKAFLP